MGGWRVEGGGWRVERRIFCVCFAGEFLSGVMNVKLGGEREIYTCVYVYMCICVYMYICWIAADQIR
jgi:hypothetical protein